MKRDKKVKTKNRWHEKETLLPKKLHEELISIFEKEETKAKFKKPINAYWRTVKLMKRVIYNLQKDDLSVSEMLELSKNYCKEILTSDYMKVKTVLWKNGVLIKKRNHSTTKHECIAYVLNKDLMDSDFVAVNYSDTKRRFSSEEKLIIKGFDGVELKLPCSPKEMVNRDKESKAERIKEKIDVDKKTYTNRNKSLTQITCSIESFINRKLKKALYVEAEGLNKICNKVWRVKRNRTNKRVDTNFTNLNSKYRKYLTMDGEKLKNIDLRNSQFTILSNIILSIRDNTDTLYIDYNIPTLTKFIGWFKMCTVSKGGDRIDYTDDLLEFCDICISGTFYKVIQGKLNISERKDAKSLMFKILFGSTKNEYVDYCDTAKKEELRSQYPTIVSIVDEYKNYCIEFYRQEKRKNRYSFKKNYKMATPEKLGSNEFSNMLQLLETNIFIENILIPLRKENHPIISIHDSFLVKESFDEKLVVDRLNKSLPMGFDYNVETYSPD